MAIRLALPDSARLTERPDRSWAIDDGQTSVRIDVEIPSVRDAVSRLLDRGEDEADVYDAVLARDGFEGLAALMGTLGDLAAAGLLHTRVTDADTLVATLCGWSPAPAEDAATFCPDTAVVLSPRAYVRRVAHGMRLESPLTRAQITLHDPRAMALVGRSARAATPTELSASDLLRADSALQLLELLWDARFLIAANPEGDPIESLALSTWEFHDLLFHARTRSGRHSYPSGQTYRLRGLVARPPVTKPAASARRHPLPRPDLDAIARRDPTLTAVIEDRRSRRDPGTTALTVEQLGEFLYRTARVKEVIPMGDHELSRRPYPNGGASYELEIYPVVRSCAGLEPGAYHYCPREHVLERWPSVSDEWEGLLEGAATAAAAPPPHVLLVIAARFQRVSWKYSSIAYAVTLKNVGVLYQTLYLVAEAMGLAGCAIGNGDADGFARVTGLDYYDEGAVGEFMLSTRA